MYRVLCVEDAEETILLLEETLSGNHLVFARSVGEALDYSAIENFDIFLVDIELPDGTGFDFISKLNESQRSKPFLFFSGRQDFAAKVSAFALGAEDYISKPFDSRELKLRLESRLKKRTASAEEALTFCIGDLVCSPQEQRVSIKGKCGSIELTSLEFRIFRMLSMQPHRVFSREEILNRVWSDHVAVTDRVVDVHVSNLRRKLNESRVRIETVVGAGYRICVLN